MCVSEWVVVLSFLFNKAPVFNAHSPNHNCFSVTISSQIQSKTIVEGIPYLRSLHSTEA